MIAHLGDITKIDGLNVPIVDCVIGGSPCQDLSVAGKRAGLAGKRSGLYMEQIRLVKEMREQDARNGRSGESIRPRYMVWENVPGAFSSNKGKDFAAVIEEAIKIVEPEAPSVEVPAKGWPTWGGYHDGVAGRWSLAWRVLDAQYWGVPQRRRRIALVVDFGGDTAGEILFERQSMLRDIDTSRAERKGTSTGVTDCAKDTVWCIKGNAIDRNTQQNGGFVREDVSYTLDATDRHGVFAPGMCAAFKLGNSEKARTIGYSVELAPTLNAESGGNKPAVLCLNDQGGNVMGVSLDISGTLRAQEHGHQPTILDMTHAFDVIRDCGQIVPTLQNRMGTGGNQVPLVFDDDSKPDIKCYNPWNSQSARIYDANGIFHSLNANENGGQSRDSVFVECIGNGQTNQSYSDICGTLNAMHDQQAIIIDDICAVDCRNGTENHDVNGTLQAKSTGGSSVNLQNVVRVNKLIRRLTPLECERLQGFPDGWTDVGDYIDSAGRKRKTSDSARYKALGNSIAIPPWTWVLNRICGSYDRPATMASLFDGIGGFPLIWERINGDGSCLWASEIEEFPMAVTRKRFGGEEHV